jgi:hypothetical protein
MTLAIIGVLFGALLGLRCKVLALVPAIMLSVLCLVLFGLTTGQTVSAEGLTLAVVAINFGYFAITVLRLAALPALRSRSLAAPVLSKSAS